jgi:hypothetical protein
MTRWRSIEIGSHTNRACGIRVSVQAPDDVSAHQHKSCGGRYQMELQPLVRQRTPQMAALGDGQGSRAVAGHEADVGVRV